MKLKLRKSKDTIDGKPLLPNDTDIDYGELFVNYHKGTESLIIKNDADEIFVFSNNGQKIISVTYAELKELRDNSSLEEGVFYRITDYETTTTQDDTIVDNFHPFDIIVQATSVNTLNTEAKVLHHEGDDYFTNNKLEKWEIQYSLDNDKANYSWADETNGKGVIFYMKDEFNNECSYDFKNIKYKLYKITAVQNDICTSYVNQYFGFKPVTSSTYYPSKVTIDTSDFVYYYTFGGETDASLNKSCYENKLCGTSYLPKIILFSTNCHKNIFEERSNSVLIKGTCTNNELSMACCVIGDNCINNKMRYIGGGYFNSSVSNNIVIIEWFEDNFIGEFIGNEINNSFFVGNSLKNRFNYNHSNKGGCFLYNEFSVFTKNDFDQVSLSTSQGTISNCILNDVMQLSIGGMNDCDIKKYLGSFDHEFVLNYGDTISSRGLLTDKTISMFPFINVMASAYYMGEYNNSVIQLLSPCDMDITLKSWLANFQDNQLNYQERNISLKANIPQTIKDTVHEITGVYTSYYTFNYTIDDIEINFDGSEYTTGY